VFTQNYDGVYFRVAVSPSGHLRIFPDTAGPFETTDTTCPNELVREFKKLNKGLYSGHFCKNIYNVTLKKFQTLLLGLTCV
jgi:hypothetical protein